MHTHPMQQPQTQRLTHPALYLGLDFGIKKMGMALGNALTLDSRPFDILAMNNGQPDWGILLDIIKTWDIAHIVVGLPLNMDGSDSALSKRAAKFARRLAHRLSQAHSDARVYLSDERLSSWEAKQLAAERGLLGSGSSNKTRPKIDDIAACLILSGFFAQPNKQPIGDYHKQSAQS